MNEDEIKGGVCYVKGKIEKGVGDIMIDIKWQVDGFVDQVVGGVQNLYGCVKECVQDVIDDVFVVFVDVSDKVCDVVQQGCERVFDVMYQGCEKVCEFVQQGCVVVSEQVKQNLWVLVVVVCVVGYVLLWLVYGKWV